MKNVEIEVTIGPYEAGSMTLGPGGISIEVEVGEGDVKEITDAVREVVDQAIKASIGRG